MEPLIMIRIRTGVVFQMGPEHTRRNHFSQERYQSVDSGVLMDHFTRDGVLGLRSFSGMFMARAFVILSLFICVGMSHAQIPVPRLKPEIPNHTEILTDEDFRALRIGLRAADDDDWATVRSQRLRLTDPVASDLLLWRIAISDDRAAFSELDLALDTLSDWPSMWRVQREAEWKISDSGMSAALIDRWFTERTPMTGEGYVSWGEALIELGDVEAGHEKIRYGWHNKDMRLSTQSETLRNHRAVFNSEDHVRRVDYLLWDNKRTSASRLLSLLPSSERRVAEARIALAARRAGVDRAVGAVPSSLTNHPGLVFERARWRRQRGFDTTLELLLELPDAHVNSDALSRMWTERKLRILTLIRDRDYITAYELASANGMNSGVAFADAEFLSGWLALTYLNDSEIAQEHFRKLESGVGTAVSLARARYWQGRAYEAMDFLPEAREAFLNSAEFPTTFYGQLSVIALGPDVAQLDLPPDPVASVEERAQFEARNEIRALRMLGEMGGGYYFRIFMHSLDDKMQTPVEQALLSDIANDHLRIRQAVRAAKAGRMQGMILAERAYPMVDIPDNAPIVPEAALTFSVIRQETEFDPRAVSPAGARGLMQMMPRVARATARRLRQPYSFHWLTHDPQYNLMLGMAHLDEVVNDYDGSLIMALAAYNAGGHRVRRWVENYGDPRTGEIDPIDWVESIPFSETRNYVQRVLENLQVYRARLNEAGPTQIELQTDMLGTQFQRDLPALPADFVEAVEEAEAMADEQVEPQAIDDVETDPAASSGDEVGADEQNTPEAQLR
jgi:soluble lytic murein transglycosylase